MSFDYSQLMTSTKGVGKDFFTILKPYLPLLKRSAAPFVEEFLSNAINKNWVEVDRMSYKKMKPEERKELQEQIFKGARQAAQDRFDRAEMRKEVLLKTVLGLLLKLL